MLAFFDVAVARDLADLSVSTFDFGDEVRGGATPVKPDPDGNNELLEMVYNERKVLENIRCVVATEVDLVTQSEVVFANLLLAA